MISYGGRYALDPTPVKEADPMARLYPTLLLLQVVVVGVLGFVLGR